MTISNALMQGAFAALSPGVSAVMTCGIQIIGRRALRWVIDTRKTINRGAGQVKSGSSDVKMKRPGTFSRMVLGINRCLPGAEIQ